MKPAGEQFYDMINKRRNVVFLLFVLATSIFWFLSRLSKNYSQQIPYKIIYNDLPNKFIFQDVPPEKISISVEASGFYLFTQAFKNRKLKISLKNIKKKNKYQYYLLSGEINRQAKEDLKDRVKVNGVVKDSLLLNLGYKSFKKVPVIPHADLHLFTGYKSFGTTLQPDSIVVSGPEMQVAKINKIDLVPLTREDVMEPIVVDLQIVKPEYSRLKFSDHKVKMNVSVEKVTEKTIEIPVEVINRPKDELVIYPKKIKASFQIKLSQFQQITEKDFHLICDYSQKEKKFIKVEMVKQPENVSSVKLGTERVEFLIIR